MVLLHVDAEGFPLENSTCPDACKVHSYASDVSSTTLSEDIVENILSQDVSAIERKYHQALELRNRLEIEDFNKFMNEMLDLQYSLNLFIGTAKSKAIGIVFPSIIDALGELIGFVAGDLTGLHSEMNKYYDAYFTAPNYFESSTGFDRIHSTVDIEMHLLRALSINVELYLIWQQQNKGMVCCWCIVL